MNGIHNVPCRTPKTTLNECPSYGPLCHLNSCTRNYHIYFYGFFFQKKFSLNSSSNSPGLKNTNRRKWPLNSGLCHYVFIPASLLEFQRVRLLAKPQLTGFFATFCVGELLWKKIKSEIFFKYRDCVIKSTKFALHTCIIMLST